MAATLKTPGDRPLDTILWSGLELNVPYDVHGYNFLLLTIEAISGGSVKVMLSADGDHWGQWTVTDNPELPIQVGAPGSFAIPACFALKLVPVGGPTIVAGLYGVGR